MAGPATNIDEALWHAAGAASGDPLECTKLLLLVDASVHHVSEEGGETPLHQAAGKGNTKVMLALLDKGADIEAKNTTGNTPLHSASLNGHTGTVETLLAKCANVRAMDNDGWTPLHSASMNGHTGTVAALLTNGADVGATTERRKTALHHAASAGHTAALVMLLEKGANIEAKSDRTWTPLLYATNGIHPATVTVLLNHGANVDAQEDPFDFDFDQVAMYSNLEYSGYTALILAAVADDPDTVRALLDAGAEIRMFCDGDDHFTDTAYDVASKWVPWDRCDHDAGKVKADAALMARLEPWPLPHAADVGDTAKAEALLAAGANIETTASCVNVMERANASRMRPVDINCGGGGRTPLHRAACNGHTTMVDMLLEKGANIEAKDTNGVTPLYWASHEGHTGTAEALLAKGADIEAKGNDGWTPLCRASHGGHTGTAEALLAKGADIEAKDNDGFTPLHRASFQGHTGTMTALLDSGADTSLKNKAGETAHDLAYETVADDAALMTRLVPVNPAVTAATAALKMRSTLGLDARGQWASRDQKGLDAIKLFAVPAGEAEYAEISAEFRKTLPSLQVDTIERVENGHQHEQFSVRAKCIAANHGAGFDAATMRRLLFHGTKEVESITTSGFEPLLSGTANAEVHGKGTCTWKCALNCRTPGSVFPHILPHTAALLDTSCPCPHAHTYTLLKLSSLSSHYTLLIQKHSCWRSHT